MKHIKSLFIFCIVLTSILLNSCSESSVTPADEETPFEVSSIDDIIMYEINIRAFSSSGTFQGITDRLDSIKALSINTIWLMPIFPIGQINTVNSPYCVKNYKEVNSEYGTLDDFKVLIEESHSRGISVVIDWVANHTAWDNPWIDSTSWYTQDGDGNIIHPAGTNWQDVADLNFSNMNMRLAMIDAMKYWVTETDIDGFRCDAADFVPYSFWSQAIDSLHNIPNKELILLAEGSRRDHFTAGFQMNYSWDFYSKIKTIFGSGRNAQSIFTTHQNEYAGLPGGVRKLRFTTNHDESAWDATPMVLFNGKDGALAASVITIYLGGVPLIYGSQEVGVTNTISFFTRQPINWSLNPDMLADYKEILRFYSESNVAKKGTLNTYNNYYVTIFKKTYDTDEILVLVNVGDSEYDLPVQEEFVNTTWQNAFDNSDFTFTDHLVMNAYQYLILKRQL